MHPGQVISRTQQWCLRCYNVQEVNLSLPATAIPRTTVKETCRVDDVKHIAKFHPGGSSGAGFTGALVAFGVTFYAAKQIVAARRKAELDDYRISQGLTRPPLPPPERSSQS
ncbi:hypothetical protein BDQ12DRAFT_723453 [Crucibulum laeve]|uniref:Uncharacterized protein n=1 Tax=Crucibulum laeve TaxID=68775 RepID=A0A5C3LZV9_9AGAR|nr:hypothetical protein BDQ12DRAFT_723453 [Crucibulum laeve]